jgi:hypothetical protein
MLRDAYIQLSLSPGNEAKLEFLQSIIGYHISRAEEIRLLVQPQSSFSSLSSFSSQNNISRSNNNVNMSSSNLKNSNSSTNSASGTTPSPLAKGTSFVASKLSKVCSIFLLYEFLLLISADDCILIYGSIG